LGLVVAVKGSLRRASPALDRGNKTLSSDPHPPDFKRGIYDMANAVLIVVHDQQRTKRPLMIPQTLILLLALSVPAIMMETRRFFLAGSIGLILLFGLIV
jgi:hypothetical protein